MLPKVDARNEEESDSKAVFDDRTLQSMEDYFHVQDRDVLLKYLRDTLVSTIAR